MRLGRADEERHILEQVAHRERVAETPAVRHQHHPGDVVRQVDAAEHLDAVGQLRDDVGPDEARDLDPLEAGPAQGVDQPDLVRGRDRLGFVLEAVAGPDLPDAHPAALALAAIIVSHDTTSRSARLRSSPSR